MTMVGMGKRMVEPKGDSGEEQRRTDDMNDL